MVVRRKSVTSKKKSRRTSKRKSGKRVSRRRSRRKSGKRVSRRRRSKRVSRRRLSKKRISRRRSRTRSKQRGGGDAAPHTQKKRKEKKRHRDEGERREREERERREFKRRALVEQAFLPEEGELADFAMASQETQKAFTDKLEYLREEQQHMGLEQKKLTRKAQKVFAELDTTIVQDLEGKLMEAMADLPNNTFLNSLLDNVLAVAQPVCDMGAAAQAGVVRCGSILQNLASAIFAAGLVARNNMDHIVAIGTSVLAKKYPKFTQIITILALMVKVHQNHEIINDLKKKLKDILKKIKVAPARTAFFLWVIFRGITARGKVYIIEALGGVPSYNLRTNQTEIKTTDTQWSQVKPLLEADPLPVDRIIAIMEGDSGLPTYTNDEIFRLIADSPDTGSGGDGTYTDMLQANEDLMNIISQVQGSAHPGGGGGGAAADF